MEGVFHCASCGPTEAEEAVVAVILVTVVLVLAACFYGGWLVCRDLEMLIEEATASED